MPSDAFPTTSSDSLIDLMVLIPVGSARLDGDPGSWAMEGGVPTKDTGSDPLNLQIYTATWSLRGSHAEG